MSLNKRADGGLYRFEAPPSEALPSGIPAVKPVDTDGLVIDYPRPFPTNVIRVATSESA